MKRRHRRDEPVVRSLKGGCLCYRLLRSESIPASILRMAQYVYTMNRVGKTVPGGRKILENISLSFFPDGKIGVLGLNGAGKSTLLRIMAGVDTQFDGEARPQKGIRIGFLPQEPQLDPSKDVRGNVEEGVADVQALLSEYEAISAKFSEPLSD